MVAGLAVALLAAGCGSQPSGAWTRRTVDLKHPDALHYNTEPAAAGPSTTSRFEPKFTATLPDGWVVTETPLAWRASDFDYGGIPPSEYSFISVVVVDGVVDDPYAAFEDLGDGRVRHAWPDDVVAWLAARPELRVTSLDARGAEYARARIAVRLRPEERRKSRDCFSVCLSLFTVPAGAAFMALSSTFFVAGVDYEVRFFRHEGTTILAVVQAPPHRFADFRGEADRILRTLEFA